MAAALVSISAFAYEDGNRDANGYVIKGPYLTNGGSSNWFVGLGAGATTFIGRGVDGYRIFPAAEAELGKWFTPSIGAQFGYSGLWNGVNAELNVPAFNDADGTYGYHYVRGDFLWNISNAIGGYKETRFWDIIPYTTAGVLVTVSEAADGTKAYAHDIAGGFGVINDFRINDIFDAYLKVGAIASRKSNMVVSTSGPGFAPAVTIGVTANISKKRNFDRYTSVAPVVLPFTVDDYRGLTDQVDELKAENAALRDSLDAEKNKEPQVIIKEVPVENNDELTLYFEKGVSDISEEDEIRLKKWVSNVTVDKLNTYKLSILGAADIMTGNFDDNLVLARDRAETVQTRLGMEGVTNTFIKTRVTDAFGNTPEENRLVTIRIEKEEE